MAFPHTFGGWGCHPKPEWEENLERLHHSIIEETGLSREKLIEILKTLDYHEVI